MCEACKTRLRSYKERPPPQGAAKPPPPPRPLKVIEGLPELGGYPFLINLMKKEARKASLRGSTSADHGCDNCPICQV